MRLEKVEVVYAGIVPEGIDWLSELNDQDDLVSYFGYEKGRKIMSWQRKYWCQDDEGLCILLNEV